MRFTPQDITADAAIPCKMFSQRAKKSVRIFFINGVIETGDRKKVIAHTLTE